MKFEDIKRGMKVYDRWWPWRLGVITCVLKTRVHVQFSDRDAHTIYDKTHCQFLEKDK